MAFPHLQRNLEINRVKNQWILQQKQEEMLQRLLLKELFKNLLVKIAGKITSADKTKSKEKEDETNKRQENYIPTEKKAANKRCFKVVLDIV